MTNSKQWGGKRECAGRKKLENPNKRYGFVSTPQVRAILENIDCKLSEYINAAIVYYSEHSGE